eukprot:m.133558 g.133558  ORF g.133558 m.133558 type:complete len:1074 (-) comp11360_c0_seq2:78-3299(-)
MKPVSPHVDLLAHFAGCNRTPQSADWGEQLLTYAAGDTVVVRDPSHPGLPPTHLLVGHSKRVNCVKWMGRVDAGGGRVPSRHGLVSGSTDCTVMVWRHARSSPTCESPSGSASAGTASASTTSGPATATPTSAPVDTTSQSGGEWHVVATLTGHTGAVTCVDAMEATVSAPAVVCSGSADGTLRVWTAGDQGSESGNGHYTAVQTVSFGSGFVLALTLATLPHSEVPLLAVGGDDCRVRLYVYRASATEEPADGAAFVPVVTLAGHEDWVRSLAMCRMESGDLMLASGSQDTFIRLWHIGARTTEASTDAGTQQQHDDAKSTSVSAPLSAFRKRALEEFDRDFTVDSPSTSQSVAAESAATLSSSQTFSVRLESLLMGHDNWVYSVQWHPRVEGRQPPVLLSASMDRTLMMWTPDATSGVWLDVARMGESGGTYTNGLFGGLFSPDGMQVIAHGFHGAFYKWQCDTSGDAHNASSTVPDHNVPTTTVDTPPTSMLTDLINRRWTPAVAPTGHFLGVRDLGWDPSGHALVSASDDQTVRVFAQCRRCHDNDDPLPSPLPPPAPSSPSSLSSPSTMSTRAQWHEVARPQIHGYDLRCLAVVNGSTLATGADEKIIRVFGAPSSYHDNLATLTDVPVQTSAARVLSNAPRTHPTNVGDTRADHGDAAAAVGSGGSDAHSSTMAGSMGGGGDVNRDSHGAGHSTATPTSAIPVGASIPALGLSNKAVYAEDLAMQVVSSTNDSSTFAEGVVLPFHHVPLVEPPLETHLVQNTLWPETNKLYGHGYELVALGVSRDGSRVVSSCKATNADHAVIRMWSTDTWQPMGVLRGHKLTVTRMMFSPQDEWLVSGSRDRQVCIFRKVPAHQSEPGNAQTANPEERDDAATTGYVLHQTIAKAHDRIVWDVAWAPSGHPAFATGARDKMVKVWALPPPPSPPPSQGGDDNVASASSASSDSWTLVSKLGKLADSVTALDWKWSTTHRLHLLAVGFDNGGMDVYASPSATAPQWTRLLCMPTHLCHTATVRRLLWRPIREGGGGDEDGSHGNGLDSDDFATCSTDGSVRLYRIPPPPPPSPLHQP